jgi:hypothetical protein
VINESENSQLLEHQKRAAAILNLSLEKTIEVLRGESIPDIYKQGFSSPFCNLITQ